MTITYFGYGSLVNTRTLGPQARAEAGTLAGWRREWRAWWRPVGAENLPKVCTLTVRRAEDTTIRGVMVSEPAERLAELDARERRYRRIDGIGPSFRRDGDGASGAAGAFLYEADSEIRRPGDDDHPILQSYVDCVLAGFHAFWGEEGVRHFIETTDGWDAPMLADRAAPRYPRAQQIEPDLLGLFDRLLAQTGLRRIAV
ncbi:gamma-glutamylcyclotransferase [Stappia sp. TSB10P1A]|uniref:gamma-glutamylcyclotransferase n=1 Tax=Stappia sp. TSB10P1A TaxID=2003585 RepID=UPI001643D312|nr:gamma-glutamylcyclotransferase [Stappia sp. TSB10P1A]